MKLLLFIFGRTLLFLVIGMLVGNCSEEKEKVEGYIPIYGTQEQAVISWEDPVPVNNPGKIYILGDYLLVNELRKGIHVFDNANPENPKALGFINILDNSDMVIKDDVLYADHLGNLVALDISDFAKLKELGRLSLRNWNIGLLPPSNAYFQCYDADLGLIVGWKKETMYKPKCYAF